MTYLILAHDAFDQVERLAIRLLENAPDDRVVIHVDAKSRLPRGFPGRLPDGMTGRVRVLRRRVRVHWGHRSQCAAILALLDAGLEEPADMLHLVSGRDWPLVPRDAIARDVAAMPDRCFLDLDDRDFGWRMDDYCLEEKTLHPGRRALPLVWRYHALVRTASRAINARQRRRGRRRSHPLGPWAKGSQWWSLPNDAATYVRDALRATIASGRLRHTQCADEHVVPTALVNSRFGARLVGGRRHIVWPEGAWSPKTLCEADMAGRGDAWFARKMDAAVDPFFYDL